VGCSDRQGVSRVTNGINGLSRDVPGGHVPLVSIEGTAYECGRHYGAFVLERYPGYRRYLDVALVWRSPSREVRRLCEQRAPYLLDVYRGLLDVTAPGGPTGGANVLPGSDRSGGCTSFGVAGSVTLDGEPICGQTKETIVDSALLYIVLRMRIKDGPGILVLAYPGEVLGYGLWSTGMSICRNAIYSRGGEGPGLTMEQWGLLSLAGRSVDEAVELARRFGISTVGNFLMSDAAGRSVNVESNAGGVSIVPGRDDICTHANHPTGEATAPYEDYPNATERKNSRHRAAQLWSLLNAERGLLTAQKALMCLADHANYPGSICRHVIEGMPGFCTTGAIVCQPTRGLLHVTRAQPCCNWPVTYSLYTSARDKHASTKA